MQDLDSESDDEGLPIAPRAGMRTGVRPAAAPAAASPDFAQQRQNYEDRARAANPSLTPNFQPRGRPATMKPSGPNADASVAASRDAYEARARSANPSLTPLRMAPPSAAAQQQAATPQRPEQADGDENAQMETRPGPGVTYPDANGSIDLLAYGRANNIARPAMGTPQSESNDPLTGGKPDGLDGSSVPANTPVGHTGGSGPLQRSFSNPTSASMYDQMVAPMARKIFGGRSSKPLARAGTRASQNAVA